MDTVFEVGQAVFGYRDGHRLLQASRTFTAPAERILLTLSDMSGPRMVPGFEEYLTAYPVPDEDCYAVTKTWYAREMQRPGCVWTHALIIRNAQLSLIKDLADLLPYFRRPQGPIEGYNAPLDISPQAGLADPVRGESSEAETLLSLLYGTPLASIIIGANDSRIYERLVCAVWSQQWPSLRASFRLCTGALANRTFGGKPFELQVVPERFERELKRDAETFVFLNATHSRADQPKFPWLYNAVGDLLAGGGNFRAFLWRYADVSVDGRRLYPELARFYDRLARGLIGMPDAMPEICEIFPTAQTGISLKTDLFGRVGTSVGLVPQLPEVERLRALAVCRYAEAFDGSHLELRSRAAALWQTDQATATNLLLEIVDATQQELTDEIMIGLAEAMSARQACMLARAKPGLLPALVTRNVRLVTDGDLWSCPVSTQALYDVLDTLQSSNAGLPVADWVPSAAMSGPPVIASAILERFGSQATGAVLNWYDGLDLNQSSLPDTWRAALLSRQDDVLAWFARGGTECRPQTLALVAATVDPHSPEVADLGLSPWQRLAQHPACLSQYDGAEAAAFLLAIGLTSKNPEAWHLVAASFERVHGAAGREQLDYRSWQYLRGLLPSLRRGREWDKCERLRRGLVMWLSDNPIPASDFLQVIHDPDTFRKLLESAQEINKGEAFFRALASQVVNCTVPVSRAQREALEDAFHRSRWGKLKGELL